MTVMLTEHHLEFLSLKGGWSESKLVKLQHYWKSHVAAQILLLLPFFYCSVLVPFLVLQSTR